MWCVLFKVFTYWLEAKKEGLKQIKAWLDGYFTINQVQDVIFLKNLFNRLTYFKGEKELYEKETLQ